MDKINCIKRAVLTEITILMLLTTVIAAPPQPHTFWSLGGGNINIGDNITAYDPDDVLCGSYIVTELTGKPYFLFECSGDDPDPGSPEDDGAEEGDIITFYVNGNLAATDPPNLTWSSGSTMEINLTAVTCTTPQDDLYINSDTTLCYGFYNIMDSGDTGVLIINASNIILDCNGTVLNSITAGSGRGIYNIDFENVTIKNCIVMNYEYGIFLNNALNNTLVNNTAALNTYRGIYLYRSDNCTLFSNTVNSNGNGNYLYQSDYNTIENNTIENNTDTGIYFSSDSNNNKLNSNLICGNGLDVNDDDANSGAENTCDTTNNWNDAGTLGCSYSCYPPTQNQTGENKTTNVTVENAPPFIEAIWELWDKDNITSGVQVIGAPGQNTTVIKCAIACDNNSIADIADVEAYVFYPDGTLKDHEYLMLSPMGSVCWQTIPDLDYDHFIWKYDLGLCNLYEGNLTMYVDDPDGTYEIMVEVNDTSGEYGNMTDYFSYSTGNILPFIEWMWELPDEDNFTAGTQVYPVPGGKKTVTKCVIACDFNGVADIVNVEADVYYPNKTLKEYEHLTPALNSSMCWQTIPAEDDEFWYKYNDSVCNIYDGSFTMEFWENPGDYLVIATVHDASGEHGYMNDTFEYMPCIAIDNDANLIDFGFIVPGSSSQVNGDNDMTTLNAPTLRNLCNVPVNISVTGTLLSCTTPATCNAATIPVPTYEIIIQPIEPGPMSTSPENFELNVPLGILSGSYQGTVILAGIQG